jgi:BASS family bile acid:Na+ symporter
LAVTSMVRQPHTAPVLVGLALVATMPVANSSVGWSQNARGNLALSLALVVFSVLLSPWITPNLLQLFGLALSASEREYCDALVSRFSGWFFIVWVILPTLLGFACHAAAGNSRIARGRQVLSAASIVALLCLNYMNASLAMPRLWDGSHADVLPLTIFLSATLSAGGMATAWGLGRLVGGERGLTVPLVFGLSMKHTGLALVLAGTVLASEPSAILMIVVATVVQHLLAGVAHHWLV